MAPAVATATRHRPYGSQAGGFPPRGGFLDGAPERYTWLPFGGGAHRCIGAALAELEIKVALSTMLGRLDLGPATREPAPAVRRGLTMVPLGGGRVRVVGVSARDVPERPAPVAVGPQAS